MLARPVAEARRTVKGVSASCCGRRGRVATSSVCLLFRELSTGGGCRRGDMMPLPCTGVTRPRSSRSCLKTFATRRAMCSRRISGGKIDSGLLDLFREEPIARVTRMDPRLASESLGDAGCASTAWSLLANVAPSISCPPNLRSRRTLEKTCTRIPIGKY